MTTYVDKIDSNDGATAETSAAPATTLPFAHNMTYKLTHTGTDGIVRTVGYVFASPSSSAGIAQEQRWILYDGPALLGAGEIAVNVVLPPERQRHTSLDAWKRAVPSLWGANATNNTYIKGETVITGFYTPLGHRENQVIDEFPKYILQEESCEWCFAEITGGPLTDGKNVEYWITSPSYAAHVTEAAGMRLGVQTSYHDLLELPRGSTESITICEYFIGVLPSTL